MLPLTRFDYNILDRYKLTGDKLGVAPWECVWILDQISKVPGHILEIGTHNGRTAKEISLAFPKRDIYCVDVCDPVYGLSVDEVGSASKECNNVKLTIQDSKDYVIPKGVGVIFIDGDHSWEGVKADSQNALSHFRTHRGIIIWHDYNWEFEVMPYLDWLREHSHLDIKNVQNTSLGYLNV